ncbi:MAG: thiamine pyrophosphate-dependent dehydrogenase E1 component subunit alpha [Acidimicrobiaceae bacterium]|nr:thiamine pyrophosphate-dependent dehydrogenase E1 component subunit alpha [Acidimicrobiaceae bacterium]MXZ65897.1 thiamine pyrophosphate-dependent dehydrogenase E1 component subunit alpha [Acidimicrobiaceae bacterium]MYF32093.1 thiamine pyrophosphate-dependent dehydrogenase E1 component subunit alpha [Acidimicrobiaceae bacterium]MYG78725.1 thiamine pyrophosphate-dependent dehydrogenase E1 component subunit alpha [Acidimicrobiaceae bacterium]
MQDPQGGGPGDAGPGLRGGPPGGRRGGVGGLRLGHLRRAGPHRSGAARGHRTPRPAHLPADHRRGRLLSGPHAVGRVHRQQLGAVVETSTLLGLYRDMWLIRAFEQGLEREFEKGNVPGMLHTGLGQEATQAALAWHLKSTDAFFPDHRCHGINALAQHRHGGNGERIMAELFGKATGVCSGKGGSLHSADPAVGNFGDNAVEGSYMATVLGVALAAKMRGQPNVACAIIGDGTVGRGEFHESLNMAAIWDLPVLYACVNNGYAISMPVGEGHASADIVDMVQGYGFESRQLDGNDIVEAWTVVGEAVEHIRSGAGPYFLEFKTWRWQGIFAGEFRPEAEVKYWKEERDPIMLAGETLAGRGVAPNDLEAVEQEMTGLIEEWIAFALESPEPDPAKATADVYVGWEVDSR